MVRHVGASQARGARPLVRRESSIQPVRLGLVLDAAWVMATTAPLHAAVALRVVPVLRDDSVQEYAGIEINVLIHPAAPPINVDFLGFLRVERVVHRDAPDGPRGVRAKRAPLRRRLRALALVLADVRRVLPRHALARKGVVFAGSLHADPIGHRPGLARRVIQNVVPSQDRPVERGDQLLERRALAFPAEVRRQVLVEVWPPVRLGEVAEGAVVAWREVSRVVAPLRPGGLKRPVRRRQAAPLRARLGHVHTLAIWEGPIHVGEAEVRGGKRNNHPHHHVDEVVRVVMRACEVDHAEHGVHIPVSGRAMARQPWGIGGAQVARELPRRDAGGPAGPCDHRSAVVLAVHPGGAAVAVRRAAQGLVWHRPLHHAHP
mmetsp:Transcript_27855/g.83949  ORF Transcript_27855/g.83949 Transcript_27855/m.83949 type:complete len:375 (+) Transcript_27855:394-1518(+)